MFGGRDMDDEGVDADDRAVDREFHGNPRAAERGIDEKIHYRPWQRSRVGTSGKAGETGTCRDEKKNRGRRAMHG